MFYICLKPEKLKVTVTNLHVPGILHLSIFAWRTSAHFCTVCVRSFSKTFKKRILIRKPPKGTQTYTKNFMARQK